jgi:hypothetical protein
MLALLHGWSSCENVVAENTKENNVRSKKNFRGRLLILTPRSFFKLDISIGSNIEKSKIETAPAVKQNNNAM